jgi:transcriptional regulator with XRE-family HTH domain
MDIPSIYGIFGARLSTARKTAKLTQAELARRVGLSRASIANIEAGNQRVFLDQVFEFAQALGHTSVNELFGEISDTVPSQRAPLVVTGAKRLTRQQEQLLSQILAEVGERK